MELESGTSRSASSPTSGNGEGGSGGGGSCFSLGCAPCSRGGEDTPRGQQAEAKDEDVEGIKGTRWATALMILVWIAAIVFRYASRLCNLFTSLLILLIYFMDDVTAAPLIWAGRPSSARTPTMTTSSTPTVFATALFSGNLTPRLEMLMLITVMLMCFAVV